ncbi:hypothetical protein [Kribbella sp. NPDC023855]|uniref:golvesin C-terminal-like domain-containing protein n=1 Tax=Kribbella sp. NPDC023855 TaxID=3154698 RepID=UPI0034048EB9
MDASMLRYTGGPGSSDRRGRAEVDRVLFSRPDSPVRTNMTVSVSYDEAHSSRYSRVINEGRSYYSELGRLSDGTILLVYGCDGDNPSFPRRVAICRFSLEWLTSGRDSLATGPRLDERIVDLGTAARAHDGTLTEVADLVARQGSRVVFTPNSTGAYVEYTVDVQRSASYQLLLRYFRSADGGLVTVTVNGERLSTAVLDTTADRADGYDVAQLGTVKLLPGRCTIRFTASGPGRGGGTLVSLDTLSFVDAPWPADVRDEVVVDNDELGYLTVRGAAWPAGTGVPGYRGGNYRSVAAGTGERAVGWRLVVPRDGEYEVQVSHTAHQNRASNAPFTITHAGGTSVVRVDQRVAGTPEPRGGSWVSLGKYRLAEGLTTIELSNDANGVVVADAVRLLR